MSRILEQLDKKEEIMTQTTEDNGLKKFKLGERNKWMRAHTDHKLALTDECNRLVKLAAEQGYYIKMENLRPELSKYRTSLVAAKKIPAPTKTPEVQVAPSSIVEETSMIPQVTEDADEATLLQALERIRNKKKDRTKSIKDLVDFLEEALRIARSLA